MEGVGGLSMKTVVVHHDKSILPLLTKDIIPVQIYGLEGWQKGEVASIGNSAIDPIQRLGVDLLPAAFDFLTFALAVTAADTFVQRKVSADGWARDIELRVSLHKPDIWKKHKDHLEELLHFLSGDNWHIEILTGGLQPPAAYSKKSRHRTIELEGIDCVSLFSGGIDSALGAIDLLYQNKKPLLVSHAYTKDQYRQEAIAEKLKGYFERFSINANPLPPKSMQGATDVSMRTRSLNFLALGVVGACAVAQTNKLNQIDLFIPENGFISLNAPLTPRRIGSLSTKTTHPHYIQMVQSLFNDIEFNINVVNPYQFRTKGEMLKECKDQELLKKIIPESVSCSNWKRKGKQCGRCIPCLIRRAALSKAGIQESNSYLYNDLNAVLKDQKNRDDLFAIITAVSKVNDKTITSWLLDSGPLSHDEKARTQYKEIFMKGLSEVKDYLIKIGVIQ